jgi:ABC-type multidrug transport system fused ATPase/permease subunit
MTTQTTTLQNSGGQDAFILQEGYFVRRNVLDWLFAALVLAGGVFAFMRYQSAMDGYEQAILLGTIPAAIAMGWFWRPLRALMLVVTLASLLGIWSYQGDLARAEQVFWLKYFLSSQSAILWMSVLFFMGTLFYWLGMIAGQGEGGRSASFELMGSRIVWAAIAMALRLNTMTGWIMWMTVRTFEHMGTIREGLQSIAVPQTVTDRAGAVPLQVTGGRIEVQGLTHHYGKGRGGLAGVDLTIAAGERIGVVGPSGAGKSSLVNLILRLRDPEGGRILIDGQDIAGVTQDSLRAQIGMVTQDSSLLHRSVRDNILYGRPNATEAQMIAAAKRAEAHEFILSLRDTAGRQGYDALVGERGVRLSGGQRQRIALARVILKDAPILILDEATSALDSEVEAAIRDTLYGMMEGKTVIAIAHRLSTIAQMDRIVVLEEGRVAEQGAHAALLNKAGLYARFWARQSGGFIGLEEE